MKKIVLVSLALLAYLQSIPYAAANIALAKHRIFFAANQRTEALQFRNTSGVTITYSAELGLTAMTEEGTIYAVDNDPLSAKGMIRYSPKRGTIPPGGKQVIRLSVRKPASLADGEYRAALLLTGAIAEEGEADKVTVRPALTFSIPIIVRNGRVQATTQLRNPEFVMINDEPAVKVWQSLNGNRSLFGNFTIVDDSGIELGALNRSAIYQPLAGRSVTIPLSKAVKGKTIIQYQEIEKFGGSLTAEAEIIIK